MHEPFFAATCCGTNYTGPTLWPEGQRAIKDFTQHQKDAHRGRIGAKLERPIGPGRQRAVITKSEREHLGHWHSFADPNVYAPNEPATIRTGQVWSLSAKPGHVWLAVAAVYGQANELVEVHTGALLPPVESQLPEPLAA